MLLFTFFCLFFLYERQQFNDLFHHFIFHFRLRFRFRVLDRPCRGKQSHEHGFGVKYDEMKLRHFSETVYNGKKQLLVKMAG